MRKSLKEGGRDKCLLRNMTENTTEPKTSPYVKTMDGSYTLKSERFGEFYHSFTGAVEESELKYIGPCEIRRRAKEGKLRILDFCFGVGYHTAAAIEAALEANPACEIEVVGLELDETLLEHIPQLNPPWKSYSLLKKLAAANEGERLSVSEGNVTVTLVLGDAAQTIKGVADDTFDCVFFDPFSPKTCPELWSTEVFSEVKKKIRASGMLATYSCARMMRESLKSAGFSSVIDGPVVRRRGPGTLAYP